MSDPDTLVAQMSSLSIDDETKFEIAEAFIHCDENNNGYIENNELQTALNKANIKKVAYQMQDVYKTYDLNQDGRLDLLEFADVIQKEKFLKNRHIIGRKTDIKQEVDVINTKSGGRIQVGKGEPRAFSAYLNQAFRDDADCNALGLSKIDLGNPSNLYDKVQDGVLICKLVNLVEPDTIPVKSVALKKLDQVYRRNENLRLGINSAASIGCQCIGTTPITIAAKRPNIILGLLWQLIKKHSFLNLNLKDNKNLANLLLPGETLEDLMNLSPEEILLRWVNYHLDKDDKYDGPKINNLGRDIKDGQAYVSLLNRVQPRGEDALFPPLNYDAQNMSDQDRAKAIQQMAERLDCGDYITPDDILEGNDRVNTLFVSHLFNTHPALEEWKDDLDIDLDETREEKTFKNWINSMDIFDPSKDKLGERLRQLNYLYPPLAGAVVILKLEDAIKEGSVEWKRVNKTSTYKKNGGIQRKLENCGYALDVAKDLKCKIIGIGGPNIAESHKMYTLAVIWQLMRKYTLKVIEESLGNVNEREADKLIVQWANDKISAAGKEHTFRSFSDKSLADSMAIFDLVDAIQPGSVDYSLIGNDNLENARFALSCCRKIGGRVYALPEDIIEVNKKMISTIFAVLMGCGLGSGVAEDGDGDVETYVQEG